MAISAGKIHGFASLGYAFIFGLGHGIMTIYLFKINS